jgi:hypothetical protein
VSRGHYTQAEMASGSHRHIAWIPSQFAKIGRELRIDGVAGIWRVTARYDSQPADWVEARSRDYLHQREASDI